MARLEYKAVAMPQVVSRRRRRGQAPAEQIAELVSKVINSQAERGWRYAGTDTFKAVERPQWWSRAQEISYSVLLFTRDAEDDLEALDEPIEDVAPRRRVPALGTGSVADGAMDEEHEPGLVQAALERRAAARAGRGFGMETDADEGVDDFDDLEPGAARRGRAEARRRGFDARDDAEQGFDGRRAYGGRDDFDGGEPRNDRALLPARPVRGGYDARDEGFDDDDYERRDAYSERRSFDDEDDFDDDRFDERGFEDGVRRAPEPRGSGLGVGRMRRPR